MLASRSITNVPESAIAEMKEKLCHVALDYSKEVASTDSSNVSYTLPDGTNISLHDERIAALEAFFNPGVCDQCGVDPPAASVGIQEAIHDCIYRLDPEVRKKLWETLVLAGGSTLASGLATRKYAPWIGGSIAASLDSFNQNMWISLNEYNEFGSSVLHRRLY